MKDKNELLTYKKKLQFYKMTHNIYHTTSKYLRNYPLIVEPLDRSFNGPAIFAANHSNSHDLLTAQEVFKGMVNVFAAEDCLNPISYLGFKIPDSVLIDRNNKKSAQRGVKNVSTRLQAGNDVVIFPEATWNMHPAKIMLPVHNGFLKMARDNNCPVIPTVFEYYETTDMVNKEKKSVLCCYVTFGSPIFVKPGDDLKAKEEEYLEAMATMRYNNWESLGVYGGSKQELLESFINNNKLKQTSPVFKYDVESEEKCIYHSNDFIYEDRPLNYVRYNENGEQELKRIHY